MLRYATFAGLQKPAKIRLNHNVGYFIMRTGRFWILIGSCVVIGMVISTPTALSGGLSADVARNAMCEEYYRSCMEELLIEPQCASGWMSPECDSLRLPRQKICTTRYEKCLEPRKGTMPVRPGKKKN
jgi:hypothetical protein